MKENNQKSITEVFGKLLARLNQLDMYLDRLIHDDLPEINYSLIDEIGSEIFFYPPKEALRMTEFALSKIKKLQNKGEGILNGVFIEAEDERFTYSIPATDIQITNAKRKLYEGIRNQLIYFHSKLLIIKESLLLNISVIFSRQSDSKKNLIVTVPPDDLSLDIRQCALLFYYIRKENIIQPLANEKLSPLLALLTGHSESKIRTVKGLGAIPKIQTDKIVNKKKKGNIECYNLNITKGVLEKILKEIKEEIKRNTKSK